MHPKTELKTISYIFASVGLATVQPNFQKNFPNQNFILFIPTLIQIIIISLELYVGLAYPEEFFHRTSSVGAFTDLVQVFGLLTAGIIQITENIWKRQIDQCLKESIERFDRVIFAKHHCRNAKKCVFCQNRSVKSFLISRTILLFVLSLAIDISILLTIDDEERIWRQSIWVRELTAKMIRLGLIYIVCHLYWVNMRIKIIRI